MNLEEDGKKSFEELKFAVVYPFHSSIQLHTFGKGLFSKGCFKQIGRKKNVVQKHSCNYTKQQITAESYHFFFVRIVQKRNIQKKKIIFWSCQEAL